MKKYEAIQMAITQDAKIRHEDWSKQRYIYYNHINDTFFDQNEIKTIITLNNLLKDKWEIYNEPEQGKNTEEEMKAAKDLYDLVEYKNSEDINTSSVREIVFLAQLTTKESFKSFLKKAIMVIFILIAPLTISAHLKTLSDNIIQETGGYLDYTEDTETLFAYVVSVPNYYNFDLVRLDVKQAVEKMRLETFANWQRNNDLFFSAYMDSDQNSYTVVYFPDTRLIYVVRYK